MAEMSPIILKKLKYKHHLLSTQLQFLELKVYLVTFIKG